MDFSKYFKIDESHNEFDKLIQQNFPHLNIALYLLITDVCTNGEHRNVGTPCMLRIFLKNTGVITGKQILTKL